MKIQKEMVIFVIILIAIVVNTFEINSFIFFFTLCCPYKKKLQIKAGQGKKDYVLDLFAYFCLQLKGIQY